MRLNVHTEQHGDSAKHASLARKSSAERQRLSGGDRRRIRAVFRPRCACQVTAQPCPQGERDAQAPHNSPGHRTQWARDAASVLGKQRENRSEGLSHADLPKILRSMLTLQQTTTPGWAKQHRSSDIGTSSAAEIPERTLQSYMCLPGLSLSTSRKETHSHLLQCPPPSPRAWSEGISTHQLSVFLAQCC